MENESISEKIMEAEVGTIGGTALQSTEELGQEFLEGRRGLTSPKVYQKVMEREKPVRVTRDLAIGTSVVGVGGGKKDAVCRVYTMNQ